MPAPDRVAESNATSGEWKALLAPMLVTTCSAEDLEACIVISVSVRGEVELRGNLGDEDTARLLRLVMPGGDQ